MNHHYNDITEKLGPPKWWDEYAVPRYCDFAPDECAFIYAGYVAFCEIACQNCGTLFNVAMSSRKWAGGDIRECIEKNTLHYGDPPNAGCCPAGPTMNSEMRRVVQFWFKNDEFEWERAAEYERPIHDTWGELPTHMIDTSSPAPRAGEGGE